MGVGPTDCSPEAAHKVFGKKSYDDVHSAISIARCVPIHLNGVGAVLLHGLGLGTVG